MWRMLSDIFREFNEDECPRLAAALAYYTVFSLPALLIATITLAGVLVTREAATERLTVHIQETMGQNAAEQIQGILRKAQQPRQSWLAWVGGMAVLFFGATGVLQELQTALNRAWSVQPDPNQGAVRHFLIKRLLSLAMLLAIAFLLLVSLVASWLLAEFSTWIDDHAADWLTSRVVWTLNTCVSLTIITLLFAAILKFVPDAEVRWSDVWAGAIATSLLFVLGKVGLGVYLAWSDPTSAFGAAGSLALILLWIYYSAMILFLGAEFTQVLARRRGRHVAPERGATRAEFRGTEKKPNTSP
jgi:membrane protein